MKFLIPIILLIVSAAAFFGFIDPAYNRIKQMQEEENLFVEALDNSEELRKIRDNLLETYNAFPARDLERLEKILPSTVDNVRLVRDVNGIAEQHGMTLRNVGVSVITPRGGTLAPAAETYGTVSLSFSVTAPYGSFIEFLSDLERSLRVADVTNVSFVAGDKDLYEYKVSLNTYWLKQ